jgi:PAS domain S-box-containing protein
MLARLHKHGKITRRALLAEMDRAIPWAELEAAMHALGDGIDAGADPTPDEMTISRFRELLARHGIGEQILAAAHLELEHDRISVTNERSAGPTPATPRAGSDRAGIELSLETMGVGVFEYDPDAGVYRFSDRCKSIWGIDGEDGPTPERLHALVHPDDRPLTAAACESLKPDGPGEYSIEHRIIRPDGAVRWVHVCGRTAFHDTPAGRRALLSHGAMLDITERRLTELKLSERDSQLRTFIYGAPVAIAMFDTQMRYLAVSRQYAADRGVSPADLVGRIAYEVFPNLPDRWRAAHARCLAGATERCDLDLWVRPDGSSDWTLWECRPWYNADQTVGGLILFSEIITQRLRGEDRLRESEARLELAIRAGALGIYDYNLVDGTTTWDARVRELWGVGPSETITYEVFKSGLYPDDVAPTETLLQESLDPRGNGTHTAEYRVVHRGDGSIRWISSTGTVFFEDGRATRLVGMVQDITDRKRTVLALAESAEELRQADHRKDAFLATLSHELRNPLAPIRTAAQILASPKLKNEQLTWARQVIQRQTTHMASLLDDLLDVARITRGKLALRKERATLASIVESAVEAARPLLDEKHHSLVVSLPRAAVVLDADPLRLSQVLSNLLANAAKYTDAGGRVELSAGIEGGMLQMSVTDNGIGIPREALGQIFTMFWQLEGGAGRSEGGLGIGLAFVKGLVELHGGTITARSDGPGRGSEFIVRLPLPATASASVHSSDASQPATASGWRVLIADDNRDAADSLALLLRLGHHDVRVAYSGRGALAVGQEFHPDVALLDIGMPELDGYGVARALRQQPWGAGVRLVAVTGWGQEEDKQRATEAGFDHHLTKPVDPEALERLLSAKRASAN